MKNKIKLFCIVVNVLQLLAPGRCQRPLSANASVASAAVSSSTTQTISTLKPPSYQENFDSDSTSLSSSGVIAIENPNYPLQNGNNNSPFKPNRGRKNTFTDLRKNLTAQKKLWERQGDDPELNENSKNPMWVLKQRFKTDVSFSLCFVQ